MKIPPEELLAAAGATPRERFHLIPPSAEISLVELERCGLKVAAGHPFAGKRVRVKFERVGEPFNPNPHRTWSRGFLAVKVRASTGAETVLYFEPGTEMVSGLVRLR